MSQQTQRSLLDFFRVKSSAAAPAAAAAAKRPRPAEPTDDDDAAAVVDDPIEDDDEIEAKKSAPKPAAPVAAAAAPNKTKDATWWWLNDQGTWTAFSAAVSRAIEEARTSGRTRVTVDALRFVDLPSMTQRRSDAPDRRRPIKRTEGPPAAAAAKPIVVAAVAAAAAPKSAPKPPKAAVSAVSAAAAASGDDDGYATEEDADLQKLAVAPAAAPPAIAAAPSSLEDDGDETEDDEALQRMAAPLIVAPDEDPDKTVALPAVVVVDDDDDDESTDEEDTDSEDETKMALDDRRKRYRCGARYVTLAEIPTWRQWLDKKRRAYRVPFCLPSAELNEKVSLWQGDMTAVELDAIVNAAKASLMGGGGSALSLFLSLAHFKLTTNEVDGAIHKAAGHRLHRYCLGLGGCAVGRSKLSPGYRLPARYIIHTVGPIGEKPELLMQCYRSTLDLAKASGIRTLAVCCISTGIYGYPNKSAAHVALRTCRKWLENPDNARAIDRLVFCVFLDRDKRLYKLYMPMCAFCQLLQLPFLTRTSILRYFPPVPKN